MITEVFHKRYPQFCYGIGGVPQSVQVFFRQTSQILFNDLETHLANVEKLCRESNAKLVRELGFGLCYENTSVDTCLRALCESYSCWNESHKSGQQYILHRLSLVELLFSAAGEELTVSIPERQKSSTDSKPISQAPQIGRDAFQKAVEELNFRLREARISLHYHNGLFQLSTDKQVETQVHEPFWSLVKDPKWKNVDIDIKESIDRRDQKGRDVALYAMKALESTIKIISDEKRWSTGKENGAANFIDNLVSKANGRFIEVWESDQLKAMFSSLRNPHGHGPGSAPLPTLSPQQENWVIDAAMIWIKSLVSRM